MEDRINPTTGRPFGKPGSHIRDRIKDRDTETLFEVFNSPKLREMYYGWVAEAPSCWPRVLNGTMTQDRFHERIDRMRKAIENSGITGDCECGGW